MDEYDEDGEEDSDEGGDSLEVYLVKFKNALLRFIRAKPDSNRS